MKILILSSLFPPYIFGGAEVVAANLAAALALAGHEVSVATLQEADSAADWGTKMPEGYTLYRLPCPRPYTLYQRTRPDINARQKLQWHAQDLLDPRGRRELRQLLAEIRPDHVDIHNIMGFGFQSLAALNDFPETSVSYTLHDVGLACFNATLMKKGVSCQLQCAPCKLSSYLRQSAVFGIKNLRFISPSQANFDSLKPFVPQMESTPKAVIRNVPDTFPNPLPAYEPSDVTRLFYAGRLDSIKGIDFLCETLSELAQDPECPKFRLTIMGKGPSEADLRRRYEGQEWFDLRGFVPREEVPKQLAQSDLFCMSSLWPETYGLVTAQALEIGVPVIGSHTGATPELVRDGVTGVIVEAGKKEAWKNTLRGLLSDKDALTTLRQGAQRYRHEFSSDDIVTKYLAFIGA